MDPSYALSTGYLTFTNNIKEKLAVIIAYFHLNFGIFLNALNKIHRGEYMKLIFDVFTGFFIFAGLIGYMIVLIYVKWWYEVESYEPIDNLDPEKLNISTSPSIITVVIGDIMGLTGFADKNEKAFLWFDQQQDISNILVYITFICLPLMLCTIPCVHMCCHKSHAPQANDEFVHAQAHGGQGEEESHALMQNNDGLKDGDIRVVEQMLMQHAPKDEGDHSLGEVFIHQVIETIEFVLGCISNTASYLRLWALSLAHGQLGEVFLEIFFTQLQGMFDVKKMSVAPATAYFFILGFGYMFSVFCVLFAMDVLEVFLHTMRLHWVEFMGKFYEGNGIPYKPFSFTEVFQKEKARKDGN